MDLDKSLGSNQLILDEPIQGSDYVLKLSQQIGDEKRSNQKLKAYINELELFLKLSKGEEYENSHSLI